MEVLVSLEVGCWMRDHSRLRNGNNKIKKASDEALPLL